VDQFVAIYEKNREEVGKMSFDKDDSDSMQFVTCAANIWVYCNLPKSETAGSKLEFSSFYAAPNILKKIVAVIGLVNSVIGAYQTIHAIKYLQC
jgi:hypothetical protein